MWTTFWDMHSGGDLKEKQSKIYIEAPEEEAISIFYSRFGHNPNRVTCTCCGSDYSISENETLEEATGFHRHAPYYESPSGKEWKYIDDGDDVPDGWTKGKWGSYGENIPFLKYIHSDDVLVIYAKDIKDDERDAHVPSQGYVWVD